jgi:hypothetical protein
VTLPVAAEGDTVAVNVTEDLTGERSIDDVRVVVVFVLVPVWPAHKNNGKSATKISDIIFLFDGMVTPLWAGHADCGIALPARSYVASSVFLQRPQKIKEYK